MTTLERCTDCEDHNQCIVCEMVADLKEGTDVAFAILSAFHIGACSYRLHLCDSHADISERVHAAIIAVSAGVPA